MQLSSMKIIITGAASGMGRSFALAAHRAGARVLACDVDEAGLASLAEETQGAVLTQVCNVADEDSVEALFERAENDLGGADGLINNAGIIRDGLLVKKDRETGAVKTLSLKKWQQVIDVNLTGVFLCSRAFSARCVEAGRKGCIVSISSVSRHGNRGQTNYSAAKAGLVAMTKLWSLELSRFGIRTGAIAPGPVDTPILMQMPEKAREGLTRMIPLGRFADPDEIFHGVQFIFENEFFTGRTIDVDGGTVI
ncbi:MAG: short-chain dehydrogenase [Myxococcales bacterium]|nr:short-chain dehydrogenase [Myxococcales bacterium]|tara:strand:+ start:282 stop:1037 length:756 start_codon:yes stop_codon:yes gene_type:complete